MSSVSHIEQTTNQLQASVNKLLTAHGNKEDSTVMLADMKALVETHAQEIDELQHELRLVKRSSAMLAATHDTSANADVASSLAATAHGAMAGNTETGPSEHHVSRTTQQPLDWQMIGQESAAAAARPADGDAEGTDKEHGAVDSAKGGQGLVGVSSGQESVGVSSGLAELGGKSAGNVAGTHQEQQDQGAMADLVKDGQNVEDTASGVKHLGGRSAAIEAGTHQEPQEQSTASAGKHRQAQPHSSNQQTEVGSVGAVGLGGEKPAPLDIQPEIHNEVSSASAGTQHDKVGLGGDKVANLDIQPELHNAVSSVESGRQHGSHSAATLAEHQGQHAQFTVSSVTHDAQQGQHMGSTDSPGTHGTQQGDHMHSAVSSDQHGTHQGDHRQSVVSSDPQGTHQGNHMHSAVSSDPQGTHQGVHRQSAVSSDPHGTHQGDHMQSAVSSEPHEAHAAGDTGIQTDSTSEPEADIESEAREALRTESNMDSEARAAMQPQARNTPASQQQQVAHSALQSHVGQVLDQQLSRVDKQPVAVNHEPPTVQEDPVGESSHTGEEQEEEDARISLDAEEDVGNNDEQDAAESQAVEAA